MWVRRGGAGASAPIVGRAQELGALVTTVARPPAVVVVEGEAGIGKTRLVGELADSPELAGRPLVMGGCHPIQEPLPLGPVLEAVRIAAARLVPAQLSPIAGALRPLLPELAEQLPAPLTPLSSRMAERHRVFRGLTEVLRALAPATLVVDDLHWADSQTLDFLRFLLHEVLPGPSMALSVVVTFRAEDADTRVPALFARLPASVARHRVVLAPLDATQTGEMVAALVGTDRVSNDFAVQLCEWTGGLPFAIEEVMALLQERGQVWRRGGRWARRTLDALAVPAAIRDQVRERAALLPAEAQPVLEAAAVLRRAGPEPLIAAVSGQPPATAAVGLSQAIDAGLLTERDEQIGFRHALANQAIYHGIPGPRRRELHDRAAEALRQRGAAGLGQVAYHLRCAGRWQEWTVAVEQAADHAVALGHDDEAVRLLEELLGELLRTNGGDEGQTGRVAVSLARAAQSALRLDEEAVRLIQQALEQPLPLGQRAELQVRSAMLQERFGGEFRCRRRLFAAAVYDLADQPELRATAMVGLAIPAVPGIADAEYRHWQQQLLAWVPRLSDPAMQVSMLGKVAMVQVATGDPQWRELTDRILSQTAGAPSEFGELAAFQSVGTDACAAGHLAAADRLLSAALAGAEASRTRRHELLIQSALVLLDYCRGRWEGLAGHTSWLVEQLDDQAGGQAKVEIVQGCLALAHGDLDHAAGQLSGVATRLTRQGAYDLLPIPVTALIRLAIGRDETAAAAEQAEELVAAVESVPFPVSAARALPVVTQALVAAGRSRTAAEVVTGWGQRLAGLDAPMATAARWHARGFLAIATGHRAAAGRWWLAAAVRFGRGQFLYEAAQAREHAAGALVEAGYLDQGRLHLAAALATYRGLGAAWDLSRAAQLARRYGVSVPARHRGGHRGYGNSLSPREREVAECAAAGRSNQEIAAELYLSPETVKSHLRSIFRKLGLRSRAGLAHRLGEESPPAEREV